MCGCGCLLVKDWDECCSPRGLESISACRASLLKGNGIKHGGICGHMAPVDRALEERVRGVR